MNRRGFLLTTSCASFFASLGHARAPLRTELPVPRGGKARPKRVPKLKDILEMSPASGTVSVALMDVATGEVLESHKPGLRLPPASTAKVITTLYANAQLGGDHRFTTRLISTGQLVGNRLEGDLILAGGGDPHLDTDGLAGLVEQLRAAGVTRIKGRFLVYDHALPEVFEIDPLQPEHVSYNPSLSGLNLNFNRVYFQWKREGDGYDLTMTAKSRNYDPAVARARMRIEDRGSPVFAYAKTAKVEQWSVARSALGGKGSRWLPIRRPWVYAGEVFRSLAKAQGVVLPEAKRTRKLTTGWTIAQTQSAELTSLTRAMLRYSTNLTAETLGLSASKAQGLKGSGKAMAQWVGAEFGGTGMKFVDHSGLGDASRVTAKAMVTVLGRAHATGLRDVLRRHPVGKKGAYPGIKAIAKTGTLNFVRGLVGYIQTDDGRLLAFAIHSADLKKRAAIPPDKRERPRGARGWANQAVKREQDILKRWGDLFGRAVATE